MHEMTEFRTTQVWMGMKDGLPRIEQRRIEDYDNVVSSSKGTPWGYEPRGPLVFQMFHQSGDPLHTMWRVAPSLPAAVNEFARWALPPRKEYIAEIVDESFRQVVAAMWTTVEPGEGAWEMGGGWFGCRAVFDEFRRQQVSDDVSIAMWEVTAMRTAPGSGMSDE